MKALLLGLALLAGSASAQESILVCTDRGRIALDVANAIVGGMPVANINFAFPYARPEELSMAEAWGEKLKDDVVEALKEKNNNPELAAQRVMEDCAYEYGKNYHKRLSLDPAVDIKQQYCYSYIKQLRALYREVKSSSPETVLLKHPPEAEGYDREKAEALVAEIAGVEHPQQWLEEKWNACIKGEVL